MAETELKALRASVTGRVQGVGFRYSTVNQARKLGLTGYARNMVDGSVEVMAEGPADKLTKLVKWLKQGPPMSHVTGVNVQDMTYSGCYRGFGVEY